MQLICPECQATIRPNDVNVQTSVAKCAACGNVFSFAEQLGIAGGGQAKSVIDLPRGFAVAQEMGDLVITRRWLSAATVGLTFFCLFWDGFLCFWYWIALTHHGPLLMVLFPLIHVAVGVILTYTVLAGYINTSEFRVGSRFLTVKHGPLPWPGNKAISEEGIDQLFCQEKASNTRNGTSVTYGVIVALRGGERVTLVDGLQQPNHAEYLEQQIEARLGIADRQVPGEMAPV